MSQEFSELPKDKRNSNYEWVNEVVIPRLIEKKLPLTQVIRVLFRAITLGITDSEFRQSIEKEISIELRQAAVDSGVQVSAPQRGDYRTLKIVPTDGAVSTASPEKIELLKTIFFSINRPNNDGVYIAPSWKIEELVNELLMGIEAQFLSVETPEEIISMLSEFILLFDALHPFLDGNGRTMRAVSNYLATQLGMRLQFPLQDGHLDSSSRMIDIMNRFRDMVQLQEGYPILTKALLAGEKGTITVDHKKLSSDFAKIIADRRKNLELKPLYMEMDQYLMSLLVPIDIE